MTTVDLRTLPNYQHPPVTEVPIEMLDGIVGIAKGGTGSSSAAGALINLGAAATNHTHALADLSDTTIAPPTNGQVLKYDSTAGKWTNQADGNTTYSVPALTELQTGTATTSRVITAERMKEFMDWRLSSIATAGVAIENKYATDGTIPTAVDLNTYVETGFYSQNLSANASAGTNYPVTTAGMLQVFTAGTMTYQTYHVYNSGRRFHRAMYSSEWSDWAEQSQVGHTHSEYAASSHNHSAANITSGTLAIARGGTGATTAAAALTALGAAADSAVVKLTGDQTIAGVKTFNSGVTVGGSTDCWVAVVPSSGRAARLAATSNGNTGLWDITNSRWLLQFNSADLATFRLGATFGGNITTSTDINGRYFNATGGRLTGSSTEMNIMGGGTSAVVRIRPQGWTSTAQTVFNANGTVTFSGACTGPNFSLSSDERLKTNAVKVQIAGRLDAYEYTRISTGERELGVMAGDVEKLYPSAVTVGEDGYKAVHYMRLIPVALAHINKLEDEVAALKGQNARLEERLARLERMFLSESE